MQRRDFIKNSAIVTTSFIIPFGEYRTLYQNEDPKKLTDWICHPNANGNEYGVFHFRNVFDLNFVPDQLILKVSADNRYRLYINGNPIGIGPARGSLNHWNYEQYDIAPYLNIGKNALAAMVINFGVDRPLAQISYSTGFFLFASDKTYQFLNTGSSGWKVFQNKAYEPISFGNSIEGKYYVCGPGDQINFVHFPDDWDAISFDDSIWMIPKKIEEVKWVLQPRVIPFLEETRELIGKIVRIEGSNSSLSPYLPLTIPPNSKVSVLFDHKVLTIGYPQLNFSGGKNGKINIIYAESLIDDKGQKGNRNEIEGKKIVGYFDCLLPDGAKTHTFSPLWLRTFRYLQLDIHTADQELSINSFYNIFTAYPLHLDADFQSNNARVNSLMDIGWRTLRLCASETYFDCPYYEQLQYDGDTRVQALISLYLTRDVRLVRNAITQLYQSINSDGIPLSRYPANQDQIIPPFSLYWVSMLYDYYMLRQDIAFIGSMIHGVSSVINYFKSFIGISDMLGYMNHGKTVGGGLPEYWYFTDWSSGYKQGIPGGIYDNYSSIISLHFVITLRQAAILMDGYGRKSEAKKYHNLADRVVKGTMTNCYDTTRGFIADTPDKKTFSQHANVLGILANAFPASEQPKIMHSLLKDDSIIKCSMYYQFYMFNAMDKAGLGDDILDNLGFWYQSIEMGLSTFPEKEHNTRSDCHAWNSSPLYEFLAVTAGVKPSEPGFKSVVIKPHFGKLNKIKATIPHPQGFINLNLTKDTDGLISGIIELPINIKGHLQLLKGNKKLASGVNIISK